MKLPKSKEHVRVLFARIKRSWLYKDFGRELRSGAFYVLWLSGCHFNNKCMQPLKYIFRKVQYFNAKAKLCDPHTIQATDMSGKQVQKYNVSFS